MFSRTARGERRVSPATYKVLLSTHIIVSVGWLGAAFAKIVLGLVAVTSSIPATATSLYTAMGVLNIAFPPLAIGTLISGVLLSLGTRWGLVAHYWVITKLVLTVGVIVTGVRFTERLVEDAVRAGEPLPLLSLTLAHVVMLAVATVLSIYKPWGQTRLAERLAPLAHAIRSAAARLRARGTPRESVA